MAFEIINDSIVRAPSSPPHPLLNSKVPLSIFDRASINAALTFLFVYEPPMPTNDSLIEGVPNFLHYVPHLAGRLIGDDRGRPCILLNNAGIRVVETCISATLSDRLPLLKLQSELKKLYPPTEGREELFQLQFNRYACGGLVLGMSIHHRLGDGYSVGLFSFVVSRLNRGLEIDTAPYLDRSAIFVPRNPPFCKFNHGAIEFRDAGFATTTTNSLSSSIVNFFVYFSPQFIGKLTAYVRGTAEGERNQRFTNFECLLTHLWKKITEARGLEGDELTHVKVAVNGRGRMKPSALLMRYFGNLVLWACPRLRVEELLNKSYAYVSKTIRDTVAEIDGAYFQSFIDFGDLVDRKERPKELVSSEPQMGSSLSPNIEVHSWLQIRVDEFDLGNGRPRAFIHGGLPVDGMMFFSPSTTERGGVEVSMALQQPHLERFLRISHSLPSDAEKARQVPKDSRKSSL